MQTSLSLMELPPACRRKTKSFRKMPQKQLILFRGQMGSDFTINSMHQLADKKNEMFFSEQQNTHHLRLTKYNQLRSNLDQPLRNKVFYTVYYQTQTGYRDHP